MANSFNLEIITPSKKFFSGEVEHIIINTVNGKEGILAAHEWTCKLLDAGKLRIKEYGSVEDEWLVASAAGGFLDMKDNAVIYVDAIEWDMGAEKRKSRTIPADNNKKL